MLSWIDKRPVWLIVAAVLIMGIAGCKRSGPAQSNVQPAQSEDGDEEHVAVAGREKSPKAAPDEEGGSIVTTGRVQTVRDARLPVEYYPSRGIKVQVRAKQATLTETGEILGLQTELDIFSESGERQGLGVVATCKYDRAKGVLSSSCPVRFDAPAGRITGTGLALFTSNETVVVQSNVTVILTRRMTKDHALEKPAE